MLPENPSFMVRGDDGVEYGPVDLDELRDWVQENRAGLGTEVRRDEPGASWQPWQTYPELVALLAEVQVTSAAPDQPATSLAPMGRRILAFGFDLILASILSAPLSYLMTYASGIPELEQRFLVALLQPDSPQPPDLMFYGVLGNVLTQTVLVLYFACFLAARGQTPAKSLLRLRVVDATGQKPYFVKSLLRALAMVFSMGLFFLPFLYAFFNPQRRALHDLIAGTWVVEA
jgi:uncharacterized RDD family membrane protein YckC